jgi:hypothetical protein
MGNDIAWVYSIPTGSAKAPEGRYSTTRRHDRENYLADSELRELNRLTTIILDIFEDQLAIGKLTLMSHVSAELDKNLRNLNRPVLNHGGNVSHASAETHAKAQYQKFDEKRRALRAEEHMKEIAALKHTEKALPKPKRRNEQERK